MGSSALVLLTICGIAFAAGGILLSKALAKTSTNSQKGETYECGIPTTGTSFIQFNVGYYLFALIFLIFDVELVFLYPWAVVYKDMLTKNPNLILGVMVTFIGVLAVGYVYIVKKGALDWRR